MEATGSGSSGVPAFPDSGEAEEVAETAVFTTPDGGDGAAESAGPGEQGAPAPVAGAYGQVCAACHGPEGRGNEELKAPSIAGLPAWYIEEQFRKFRNGQRGAHGEDLPGQQMRVITSTLTDEQIQEAAISVASLPVVLTEMPEDEKNIARGRYIFANVCMECHRYNGKGEPVFHSAQLISLNRSYLRRQLLNFHSGKRGDHPDDIYGNKMVNVTKHLSEEDLEILVDYIGALAHGDDPRPERER